MALPAGSFYHVVGQQAGWEGGTWRLPGLLLVLCLLSRGRWCLLLLCLSSQALVLSSSAARGLSHFQGGILRLLGLSVQVQPHDTPGSLLRSGRAAPRPTQEVLIVPEPFAYVC